MDAVVCEWLIFAEPWNGRVHRSDRKEMANDDPENTTTAEYALWTPLRSIRPHSKLCDWLNIAEPWNAISKRLYLHRGLRPHRTERGR